jgi:hypothetical protein
MPIILKDIMNNDNASRSDFPFAGVYRPESGITY